MEAQAGLPLCCSQTPKDRFSHVEAHIYKSQFISLLNHDFPWSSILSFRLQNFGWNPKYTYKHHWNQNSWIRVRAAYFFPLKRPNVKGLTFIVWFDSLHTSQQFFSYVRVLLDWISTKQGSSSRTQPSAASVAQTWNPSILRQALYHWATALPGAHI